MVGWMGCKRRGRPPIVMKTNDGVVRIDKRKRDAWIRNVTEDVCDGVTNFSYVIAGDSVVMACRVGSEIIIVDAQVRREASLISTREGKA